MIRAKTSADGSAANRFRKIGYNARDLAPIKGKVVAALVRGKRDQLERGVDAAGRPFTPLAKSTLKKARLVPTPLIPQGDASRLIVGYRVEVVEADGRATFEASWPSIGKIVGYLRTGTRRMPRRDPTGFRRSDLDWIGVLFRQHVLRR